jgi:hypothetical protein
MACEALESTIAFKRPLPDWVYEKDELWQAAGEASKLFRVGADG